MLEKNLDNGILTIRLAHGKASALDLELCNALASAFEEAAADDDVGAVILTGTGSIFCAGVDLPRMIDAGGDYVQLFVEALDAAFRGLFAFPKPCVAAMNGHAIAGGAILGFACDHRLMSGGRIGVPEPLVGVPFPPLAMAIVRYAVPKPHLQPMVYFGKTMETDEAKEIGIIDEIPPAHDLLGRAHAIAQKLMSVPRATFRITKRQLREPYLRDASHIAVASVDEIDAIWAAPETHAHIREYLAKTLKKK
ncbi:MAG: enoyl-CoA hydratase [Thermoanaerobaculia bacterium]|jgi:enoyl-CoA hydratase|nr:enoyl-CoA hydratase [Thermoanaerobaculia bacterium]